MFDHPFRIVLRLRACHRTRARRSAFHASARRGHRDSGRVTLGDWPRAGNMNAERSVTRRNCAGAVLSHGSRRSRISSRDAARIPRGFNLGLQRTRQTEPRLCLTNTLGFNPPGIPAGGVGFNSLYRCGYSIVSPPCHPGPGADFGPSAIRQTEPRRGRNRRRPRRARWSPIRRQAHARRASGASPGAPACPPRWNRRPARVPARTPRCRSPP